VSHLIAIKECARVAVIVGIQRNQILCSKQLNFAIIEKVQTLASYSPGNAGTSLFPVTLGRFHNVDTNIYLNKVPLVRCFTFLVFLNICVLNETVFKQSEINCGELLSCVV